MRNRLTRVTSWALGSAVLINVGSSNPVPAPQPTPRPSLESYFDNTGRDDVLSGGVKMIPIKDLADFMSPVSVVIECLNRMTKHCTEEQRDEQANRRLWTGGGIAQRKATVHHHPRNDTDLSGMLVAPWLVEQANTP
jgi:hypothetical protein